MKLYAIYKDYATAYLEAIENASTEDKAAAHNAFADKPLDSIISREDGSSVATISITGFLSTAGPTPLARFFGFGGTGYVDIISAAKSLADDPTIIDVDFKVDTPGGEVAGMDQARQAIEFLVSKKNVVAENHGLIASAGYFLVTPIKEIVAMSPLVKTGSIGVIKAGLDFTDMDARVGIKKIRIVSANAPNKQADPTTPEGLKVHQADVDAMERVFIRTIAKGRGLTDQQVIDNFGKGGTLIALDPDPDKPDALKAGMIDSVITKDLSDIDNDIAIDGDSNIPETSASNGGKKEGNTMDLSKLKTEHPAIYAQAVEVGVEQGIATERERVSAHVVMGKAAGDMELAMTSIETGVEHTAATNAKYMAAQMNKKAVDDRAAENVDDLDTDDTDDSTAHETELATVLAGKLGVEING